jgi:UMF1 family MFS transporter
MRSLALDRDVTTLLGWVEVSRVAEPLRSRVADLGVETGAQFSWVLYDWANSAFATTVIAAVFPIYYRTIAADALASPTGIERWLLAVGVTSPSVAFGYTTAISLALVAVASPVLGALADHYRLKRRFLAGFLTLGVGSTAGLFLVGDLLGISALFALANIGFVGANVFYDSLLPHVADPTAEAVPDGKAGEGGQITDGSPESAPDAPTGADADATAVSSAADRLSTAGYATGYLGGGLLLVVNLAWVLSPGTFGLASEALAVRLSLASVAVWWAAFSIPLFAYVPEPDLGRPGGAIDHGDGGGAATPIRIGYRRVVETAADFREYRDLLVFLVAFLLYADGIGTIIRMASIYGAEIGIDRTGIIGALVLVQFLGIPFAFLFGGLADRVSTKRALTAGLVVYTGISVGGYFMTETWHFWALAIAVATVQGGTQALSRSLYGTLVPRDETSKFFSFFSISSKFAGIAGPALFATVGSLTGSSRLSIVSLLVFFVGGGILLQFVDVERGRRLARETASSKAGPGPAAGTRPEGAS